jgi:uncharacterized membrane protein YfcA
MNWISIILLIVIGLCAGCITGLIGASGILVVVPALTIVLAFPVHTAIGTSLAVDVIASVVVSYIYYRKGRGVKVRCGVSFRSSTRSAGWQ